VDGTKRGAINIEIELKVEATQKMGQNENGGYHVSLDVKCLATHKNTPKGNEIGEPSTTIVSRRNNFGKIATHIPLLAMTS